MTESRSVAGPAARADFLPVPEFDLAGTLDGGQAFRWHPVDGGDAYRGVVGRSVLRIEPAPGGLTVRVEAGQDITPDVIGFYLGLEDDLEALRRRYADDPGLGPAMADYTGLRLLRQDPWECLCGFICSATSNVPRIKQNMNALAGECGERIGPGDSDYAFPGPVAVASAGEDTARRLGWGFRARYLAGAAAAAESGALDLRALAAASYEEARDALMGLNGVGEKIADCVLAFSLAKGLAFPVDRWVRRAMEQWYGLPSGVSNSEAARLARERFGEDAAYAQQYLFHRQRLAGRARAR